jgi:aminoglycoside phosphotransferase (APT) family kinase protein
MMARLLDAEALRLDLVALAHDRLGAASLVDITAQRLNRRVIRYTLRSGAGRGAPREWRLIGKVYDEPELARSAYAAFSALWDGGFAERAPQAVCIPEPYAFLGQHRMLLMQEAPGLALKELVKTQGAAARHVRLFAEALVKLHRSPPPRDEPFTVDDHLARRCIPAPDTLARAFPDLAEAVHRIVDTARDWERALRREDLALAHGDFHLGQANIDAGRLWILDLDPLHFGDPAYDLAMVFVSFGRLQDGPGRAAYLGALRNEFLSTYFSAMDLQVASRIPLHLSLILLKQACKRYRWQNEPGWEGEVRRLVGAAGAAMRAMRRRSEPRDLGGVVALYERCRAN